MTHHVEIIVEFPDVETTHELPLNDLTGARGRWDVVCRCVMAAKQLSVQHNLSFLGLFTNKHNPRLIHISPGQWRQWPATEGDIALHLSQLLTEQNKTQSAPPFHQLEHQLFNTNALSIQLTETGENIQTLAASLDRPSDIRVFIGAERGQMPLVENWLHNRQVKEISLGTKSYLASQCITLLGYYLKDLLSINRAVK